MHRHTHTHKCRHGKTNNHQKTQEKHRNACGPKVNKTARKFVTSAIEFASSTHAYEKYRQVFSCVRVFVSMCDKLPLGAIRLSHNMAKPRSLRNRAVSTRFQHSQTEKRKEKRRSDRDAGNDVDKKRVTHRQSYSGNGERETRWRHDEEIG